jgi:DNA modification methylase
MRQDIQIGLEPTPAAYVARLVEVFEECRRVLRDDGTLWLNLGDSYSSIGHPKSHSGFGSTGLAGGKAQEHSPVRRENDASSIGLKHKDLVGIPWRVAFALQDAGWYLRSDIIWAKPNPMPESVTDRPTKAHEYMFLLTKRERYFYDAEAIRETGGNGWHGGDFKDFRKATIHADIGKPDRLETAGRNKRSVWTIATEPYREAHFATFPTKLVEPCILAGCPVGGTVLDPFLGSGTTIAVAVGLGRHGIGIEINPAYVELAHERIAAVQRPLLTL